ncbi:hypothetical protein NY10_2001 [Carnobacterium antarcticum]|nr:hypothetical protein NY10_2001 [Carnobacterium sp. CP1]
MTLSILKKLKKLPIKQSEEELRYICASEIEKSVNPENTNTL